MSGLKVLSAGAAKRGIPVDVEFATAPVFAASGID